MSTQTILIVLIVLAVLILGFWLFSVLMRRRTENQIIALEERKEALFDLPIQDEFDTVKEMHLVGQSQKVYREWHQKWVDLSQNSFADLENSIFETEQLNASFRWSRAREAATEAEGQLSLMEADAARIREGVSELMEQEQYNSTKIQDALDLYDELRNQIADSAEHYGSAIGMIEQSLSNIESEFNQFVELNSKGDPVEAAEILEIAEEHTIALKNIVDRIPEIIHLVDDTYEKQIAELETTHGEFIEQNYKFPETFNLDQSLKNIRDKIKNTRESLERFEIDRAESLLGEIKQNIDQLYGIFEKEYTSRRNFEKNSDVLKAFLEHTRENNRELLLEIDQALHSYILSESEKSNVRSWSALLDDLEREIDEILNLKNESVKEQPYSMMNRRVAAVITALQEMESNQLKVSTEISNLSVDEKKSKETVEELDGNVRVIRRFVAKRNLPGLPNDYLDLFQTTNAQVGRLAKELNKPRINMDQINHLTDMASEQLEILKTKTDNLLDKSDLTEQLIQYANRYKTTSPAVATAIGRSLQLFERDWDYTAAYNTISSAVDSVEPGASDRITSSFLKSKPVPEYRL